MILKTFIIFVVTLISYTNSARILGVVPMPFYSHQQAFQPIWRALSLRGHEVVTITTDPINDPELTNLTEISVQSAYAIPLKYITKADNSDWLENIILIDQLYATVNEHVLSHNEVQKLIKRENEHFDVVIIEIGLYSYFAFAERFKAPLILVTSIGATPDIHSLIGNPIHGALYPHCLFRSHYDPILIDRVFSVIFSIFQKLNHATFQKQQDGIIKKYFGDGYSSINDLMFNISLILSNSDPIFDKVKPLLPTIIEFGGGTHRAPPKPLPKELKTILDEARNGFIYFSVGSVLKSNLITNDTRNIILETFAQLPYTVLWKFEDDNYLPNKPKNVYTFNWLPQQDVLRHPNVKLFITPGGLQSLDEAIYEHVPMLILPFASDQHFNAYRAVAKGFASALDSTTMTVDSFKKSILEVIDNPKYKNKLKELVKLVQDQPMTGLEKALWWIEYVIRHKGTAHLRSPYLDVPTYQYYYLDVIAFFTLITVIVLTVLILLIKFLWNSLFKICANKLKTS